MKKTIVLTVMAALGVSVAMRFNLSAQDKPEERPTIGADQSDAGSDEVAESDNSEQLDQSRVFVGENYFVAPVTTPLQRLLLGKYNDQEPVAYANINAKSFIVPGTGLIDTQGLNFSELRRALRQIAEHQDGQLRVLVNYGYSPPNDASRNVEPFLREAFEGMGHRAGFGDVWAYSSVWNVEDYVWKPIDVGQHQDGAAEENAGSELMQVFPVRTSLSHYLTGGGDCYIRLDSPPLDKWDDAYQETIRKALETLEADRRGKVKILILMPRGDGDPGMMTEEEVLAIQSGLGFESDAVNFMQSLGFEDVDISVQKGGSTVGLDLRPFHK
jgi:hypothetical protein